MNTDPTADLQVSLSEQPGPTGEPAENAMESPETASPGTESTSHRSLERGFRILDVVMQAKKPISGADIAGIVGLHRSTVFQLTKMLVRAGLLKQWEISKQFEPGPKLHEYLGLMMGVEMSTEVGKLRYASREALQDSLLARQEKLYQECKAIAAKHGMRVSKLVPGPHPGSTGANLAIVFKGQDPGGPAHIRILTEAAEITPEQWARLGQALEQPREEVEAVPNQEQAAGLLGPDEKGGGLRT